MVAATIPQVVYYSRVGVEVIRLVARGQGIGLPYVSISPYPDLSQLRGECGSGFQLTLGNAYSSSQQFSTTFQPLLNALRNPTALMQTAQQQASSAASAAANSSPAGMLSRIRGMDGAQWATAGVVFAEVLGFFTVGEMVGRMKFVGYRGEVGHGHH